jgi:hypothetical protein
LSCMLLFWYRLGIFYDVRNFIIVRQLNFFFAQFIPIFRLNHVLFFILYARWYLLQLVLFCARYFVIISLLIFLFHLITRRKKITKTFLNSTVGLKQHLCCGLLYTKKYLNKRRFIFINFLNYIVQIIVFAFKDKSLYALLKLAKFYYSIKRYFTDHLFTKCVFLKLYIYEWYVINLYYASWSIKNFRKLSVKLVADNAYNMYGRFIRYLNFRHRYFLENSKRYFLIMHWWKNISLKQAHIHAFFASNIIKLKFNRTIKNIHKSILAPKTRKKKNSLFSKFFNNDEKKK